MTTTLITRLRELMAKATPPPWAVNPARAQVDAFSTGEPLPVCQLLWPTDERTEDETFANGELIAKVRNDLPALLDRLERLEKVAEAAKEVISTADRPGSAPIPDMETCTAVDLLAQSLAQLYEERTE